MGEAARLTTPKDSAVFTIRLNSKVEGNGFDSILMNDSIKVSKLLVAQKNGIAYYSKFARHLHYAFTFITFNTLHSYSFPHADYCDCCDFSAIEALQDGIVSASFNVCTGLREAPQACICSNEGLEVRYCV